MHSSFLRHALILIVFILQATVLFAQPVTEKKEAILKINVPALLFKNISLQYEQKINKKNSFALAVRFMPKHSVPFRKTVQDLFTDTTIKLDQARMGNIGITPEYRFYLSKQGALKGFYIGGFVSFNHYNDDIPINYYDYVNNKFIDKIATFKGSMNTVTGGIQLGAQWKLSESLNLDWWIAGPNYGINKGEFKFIGSLNPTFEQVSLYVKMNLLKEVVPLVKVEIPQGSPNDNGASFKTSGGWAGIRAMGLNLGYRF